MKGVSIVCQQSVLKPHGASKQTCHYSSPPPPPQASELLDDRTDTYLRAIRDVLTPRLQLVVCVFPTQRDDRYSAVKKLCCCDRPVPSQCINSRTIGNQQKLKSVTQKIVLQVGGVRVGWGGVRVGWGLCVYLSECLPSSVGQCQAGR